MGNLGHPPFCFAHAEAIIPLAALMKLEGSRQGASPDQLFSQQNNEWRGGWVSPYTANIQGNLGHPPF